MICKGKKEKLGRFTKGMFDKPILKILIFYSFCSILTVMKKLILLGIILCPVFFFFGCATTSVQRVDSKSNVDLSGRWNANDFQIVSESLINSCLESQRVDQFIKDYRSSHGGTVPACVVDRFANDTAEHIDTNMLADEIKVAIINSGRMDFVAGGDTRAAIRDERQDQQGFASEETAASLGNETGAALWLRGRLMYIGDRAGNVSDRYYVANAELIDISTARIIWSGKSDEIRKVVRQANVKL